MADILRVSFPGSEKNYVNPTKIAPEVNAPFNIVDLTKVTKPQSESSLLQQNNSGLEQSTAPAILQEMLEDPKVTVTFLRNIFMLEEIFRLLPSNNSVVTEELQKLFDSLMLKPDQLLNELLRQSGSSTKFTGDVFSILRGLEQGGDNRMRDAVINLLKAFSGEQGRQEIMRSVSNNLFFLGISQQPLKTFSEKLLNLSEMFKAPNANFETLKAEVLELLKQQDTSLLNSPNLQKLSAMLVYNLSRYQSNNDYLPDAINRLAVLLERDGTPMLEQLKQLINNLIETPQLKTSLLEQLSATRPDFHAVLRTLLASAESMESANSGSKVMAALAEIITKEGRLSDLQLVSDGRINDIITSLLSSPCNYTPLLHMVFPLDFLDMRSFAEMWVDNNPEEWGEGEGKETQHVLIAFDIEGIGAFETEIFVQGRNMQVLLLCPSEHTEAFSGMKKALPRIASQSGYRLTDCIVHELVRGRSLMEVFKELPNRRMGLSVKA